MSYHFNETASRVRSRRRGVGTVYSTYTRPPASTQMVPWTDTSTPASTPTYSTSTTPTYVPIKSETPSTVVVNSDKSMLYLGGGLAALLLIGVAVYLTSRKK
jgi:hypothetical protein